MLFEMMDDNKETSNGTGGHELTTRQDTANASLSSINLFDSKQLAAAENFLTKIMRSEKGGIKSINDGLAVLMRAQDLQLPFSTCIEHIHVINGKTGVDIHIIKSLLLRAGVIWDCTQDYTPQYNYTDGNTIYSETLLPKGAVKCRSAKDAEALSHDGVIGVYPLAYYTNLKGDAIFNEFELSDKCVKAINRQQAMKLASEGKYPVIRIPAQPIDFVTEYKFTRFKVINGKERIMTVTSHFSLSEARAADFFEKDTYKKYARVMIGHRAFTLGARDIGSDLLMGVLETSELRLVEGVGLDPSDFIPVEEVN